MVALSRRCRRCPAEASQPTAAPKRAASPRLACSAVLSGWRYYAFLPTSPAWYILEATSKTRRLSRFLAQGHACPLRYALRRGESSGWPRAGADGGRPRGRYTGLRCFPLPAALNTFVPTYDDAAAPAAASGSGRFERRCGTNQLCVRRLQRPPARLWGRPLAAVARCATAARAGWASERYDITNSHLFSARQSLLRVLHHCALWRSRPRSAQNAALASVLRGAATHGPASPQER